MPRNLGFSEGVYVHHHHVLKHQSSQAANDLRIRIYCWKNLTAATKSVIVQFHLYSWRQEIFASSKVTAITEASNVGSFPERILSILDLIVELVSTSQIAQSWRIGAADLHAASATRTSLLAPRKRLSQMCLQMLLMLDSAIARACLVVGWCSSTTLMEGRAIGIS